MKALAFIAPSMAGPRDWVQLALAIGIAACGRISHRSPVTHPAELTGRWVRLRKDGTWGDTMVFRADGSVRGSAGYVVPAGLRWRVNPDTTGGRVFCAEVYGTGFCRPYRLRAGTLELVGGPQGTTVFRRAR
jgi:hypothetical protein